MTKSKSLKLILKRGNDTLDVDYKVHDSTLADKWFKKIKHLKNVPIDPIESGLANVSDLKTIHRHFCDFAGVDYEPLTFLDQEVLNNLHHLYEKNHDRLAGVSNNSILYKFHHAVHYQENKLKKNDRNNFITVGWGIHEGPLTNNTFCGGFYETKIIKNFIYLPWAELGKTPLQYWRDKEPNDQERFNALAKPHFTFRAKFSIALQNIDPPALDPQFELWFKSFKKAWLDHHGISKWDELDEYSAPLLATTADTTDLQNTQVVSILIA